MAKNKKLELVKRDMNFFSDFTASSGQMGSYISLALLVLLGLLIVGSGIYAVVFLQTATVRNNINVLNAKMQGESYQADLAKFTEINSSMAGLNQQYYDVSSLLSKVQGKDKVQSSYMDTIYSNIPKDIAITKFAYTGGTITLTGEADSYYSPLDLISNLSKAKLFTYVAITNISQVDVSTSELTPADLLLTKKYTFEIQGSLKSNYVVLISRLIDSTTSEPLTAVKSQTLAAGESFTESGVNTYTSQDGSVYTLSRVLIDNVAVSETTMAAIRQNDSISGLVASSVDIKLFYTLTSTSGGAQ